ncbi:MAG: hypothetical protein M3R02_24275 [Chloroflexota bacterium]|nr:hypothetical protein [Chloroflexota bacterium]
MQDFDLKSGVVVAPGETYAYRASRSFANPGVYGFDAAYRGGAGDWHRIPAAASVANTAGITVGTCGPKPVVTGGLVVTPNAPTVNGLGTATFTVTNTGCQPFTPDLIGAGGRGPGGDADIIDFWLYHDVVLQPG